MEMTSAAADKLAINVLILARLVSPGAAMAGVAGMPSCNLPGPRYGAEYQRTDLLTWFTPNITLMRPPLQKFPPVSSRPLEHGTFPRVVVTDDYPLSARAMKGRSGPR